MTIDLFFSPNGFDWTPYENNPVVDTRPRYGRWGPTMFMGWDDIRQVYAVHMENALHRRSAIGKRLIGRSESPDLYEWTDPETILVPDERDSSDTEFYALPAITYEGLVRRDALDLQHDQHDPLSRGRVQPRRHPLPAQLQAAVHPARRPARRVRLQLDLRGRPHRARRHDPHLLQRHQLAVAGGVDGAGRPGAGRHRSGRHPP